MANTEYNPYKEQDIENVEMPVDDGSRFGSDSLSNVKEMQIGSGTSVFRGDQSGIWLGSDKFATAPFSVDMDGNCTASSIVLTGYTTSAQVTTIIGDTVDTGYVNALEITVLGTVTAGTLIGTTIKTSSTGERIVIDNDSISSYDSSNALRMFLQGSSLSFLNSSGIGVGSVLATSSTMSIGNLLTNGNTQVNASGTGSASLGIDSTPYFYASGTYGQNIANKDIIPIVGTLTLGESGNEWSRVYTDSITLNGVTRTSWPSAGTTTLSGLSIDTNKNWGDYVITNIGGITLTGTGDSFNCNFGFIDDCRSIYFETGTATNPTVDGQVRYYEGGSEGLRVQIAGGDYQFDATSV
jgi:hypothetical protein